MENSASSLERIGDITLNNRYWDCECKSHYIHEKANELVCPVCGAVEDEMPDSRAEEVEDHNLHFKGS